MIRDTNTSPSFLPTFKKFNLNELEQEQEDLYKNFDYIFNKKEYSEFLYKVIFEFSKDLEKIVLKLNDEKIEILKFQKELQNDFIVYLTNFIESTYLERKTFIKEFSIKLITKYSNIYPEEEYVRVILNSFLHFISVQKEEISEFISKSLKVFFILELKMIALNLKDFVPKIENKKMNELIENSIHIVMSSSSDMLGNYLNLVEQKAYLNKKLINKLDILTNNENHSCMICQKQEYISIIETIKDMGFPLQNLINYASLQSSLFTSFKNEIKTNCTSALLENIFTFVFKNGFKVKHNNITIHIKNELENVLFSLNEYIFVNSVYSILENAIEAEAANITIDIFNSKETINIDFFNDGTPIEENINSFIFDKFFTTKVGHYGLGLSIAKVWLENISCKLFYIEDEKKFRISLPIEGRKKESE